MAEEPRPCPHCQGTDLKIAPRYGYGVVLTCQDGDCLARIWGHDEADVVARWNHRVPGPKTMAMLAWVEKCKHEYGETFRATFDAFLAEWPEPGSPPAPDVTPMKLSPWTCCICGKAVRIADDLRPHHIDGPTNHEAELSNDDLKILADGLRLTD